MPTSKSTQLSSQKLMFITILGNVIVTIIKLIAAIFTGSSAMMSEAVHSVVDLGNSLLLLYGLRRAKEPASYEHPLGHGRELYFWSFVVALMVFALSAGVAFYEGVSHILNPEPIQNETIIYVVLGLSAIFEGITWWIALKDFRQKTQYCSLFKAFRENKDPPSFMVFVEDSAALVGIFIAFMGAFLSAQFAMPELDGVASILIAIVLAITAGSLTWQTKSLLMGEAADQSINNSIIEIAENITGVAHANGIITVHLGPQQIVVALSLEFADALKTPEIENKIAELELRLQKTHPAVIAIFVKPQCSQGYKDAVARQRGQLQDTYKKLS